MDNENPHNNIGRWAFRPPQFDDIVYFIWVLPDGVLFTHTFNVYQRGLLQREPTEALFRKGLIWSDKETSIVLSQFTDSIQLSEELQHLIIGLSASEIFGVDDAKVPMDTGFLHVALSLDVALAKEIDPQMARSYGEWCQSNEEAAIRAAIPPTPCKIKYAPKKREAGKWLLTLCQARYICHYGIHILQDGTVEFYDLFSHRFLHHQGDPTLWPAEFWFREFLDEEARHYGHNMELACRYSTHIKLNRRLIKQILRANARNLFSITDGEEPDLLSRKINMALETKFWAEIIQGLTCQPQLQWNPDAPEEPFPSCPNEAIMKVPVRSIRPPAE